MWKCVCVCMDLFLSLSHACSLQELEWYWVYTCNLNWKWTWQEHNYWKRHTISKPFGSIDISCALLWVVDLHFIWQNAVTSLRMRHPRAEYASWIVLNKAHHRVLARGLAPRGLLFVIVFGVVYWRTERAGASYGRQSSTSTDSICGKDRIHEKGLV